jgi:SAM-dependent methyltransferase
MSCAAYETAAARYEAWYGTPLGQRVDRAERDLLDWLLAPLGPIDGLLDVGCGTGHFTGWLRGRHRGVVGLDRSPAMVRELRARRAGIPVVIGDAERLPFRARSVDVALFVTALEFVDDPAVALSEAAEVARSGIVVVALNRWSAGGLSRRFGPQARSRLRGRAHDWSLRALREVLRAAAGPRLRDVRWASTLLPGRLWPYRSSIPMGDVIGVAGLLGP